MNRITTTVAHIRNAVIAAFPQYSTIWCQICVAGKGRVILLFTFFDSTGYTMRTLEFKNFVQVKEVQAPSIGRRDATGELDLSTITAGVFEVTPALTIQSDNIITQLNK